MTERQVQIFAEMSVNDEILLQSVILILCNSFPSLLNFLWFGCTFASIKVFLLIILCNDYSKLLLFIVHNTVSMVQKKH